jgi:hypothetical protein
MFMQTNISKNQNTQIPSEQGGAASIKTSFTVEHNGPCLLIGREHTGCAHKWCYLAAKEPQYWALFKSDYIMNREDVKQFELFPERHYGEHIIKRHVRSTGVASVSSYAQAYGYWPVDRNIFDKSEVSYILIEEKVTVPVDGCYNSGSEMIDTVDLIEVAIYISNELAM